jgi:hypothetical protein
VIDGAFGVILRKLNCPFQLVHGFKMMMFFQIRKVITIIRVRDLSFGKRPWLVFLNTVREPSIKKIIVITEQSTYKQ